MPDTGPSENRPEALPRSEPGGSGDLAKLVVIAGTLLELLGAGLAAGDVDQPSAWGRTVFFAAFGLAAFGITAASAAIIAARSVGQPPPRPLVTSRSGLGSDDPRAPETIANRESSSADARVAWYTLAGAASVAAAISLAGVAFASDSGAATAGQASTLAGTPQRGNESDDELAREFRPVLFFDSREQWRPLNVDLFLAEEHPGDKHHRICGPAPNQCSQVSSVGDLLAALGSSPSLGQGMYLDLAGEGVPSNYSSPRLHACQQKTKLDCDGGEASAIYYNVSFHSGLFFIDYWWFLRFNNVDRLPRTQRALQKLCRFPKFRTVCFDHEGDWEGVTVVASAAPPQRLEAVIFAAHEWTLLYTADRIMTADGRPEVYIARGSHAAYPGPCNSRCKQPLKRKQLRWPEGQHNGLAPWGRNVDKDCFTGQPCVLSLPPTGPGLNPSWTQWAGNWGYVCGRGIKRCRLGDGPRSPGTQKRYRTPWCAVGTGGANCDIVAEMSRTSRR
jgi:hypothetical protein